jgi:hypothetical protein
MISTEQKIIQFLVNTKDHASSKRDIRMRIRHRSDFAEVYQSLLDRGVIQEYGLGLKKNTRMVCITFEYLFENKANEPKPF